MDPLVRLAALKDLPALMALYAELNPDDPEVDPMRCKALYQEILASQHFEVIVAEVGGAVAGTCYLNVIPNISRSMSPCALLENVVTQRRFRRRGIGKAMVSHALGRAWQRGCYKVMLQTGSYQEGTHNFYRSCGFSSDEKVAFVARPHRGG